MKEIFLALFLAAATAADLKWQKIPNELILFGSLTAMMICFTERGFGGAACGMLYGLMTVIFYYVFYMIGAVGAGDVKLLAVVGMTTDMATAGYTAFFSLMTAGAAALFIAVRRRELVFRMSRLAWHAGNCLRNRKLISYRVEDDRKLHYALYLSAGFIVTVFFRKELL